MTHRCNNLQLDDNCLFSRCYSWAHTMLHTALCALYFAVLLALSAYGLHRLHLVLLCWRHRDKIAAAPMLMSGEQPSDAELPVVTIQLPLFNESTVVARLLEAVARMNYPLDKFE